MWIPPLGARTSASRQVHADDAERARCRGAGTGALPALRGKRATPARAGTRTLADASCSHPSSSSPQPLARRNRQGGHKGPRGSSPGLVGAGGHRQLRVGSPRPHRGPTSQGRKSVAGRSRRPLRVAAAAELCFWAQPQPNFLSLSTLAVKKIRKTLHFGFKAQITTPSMP